MSTTNMLEVVRAKDADGTERNMTRAEAKRIGADVTDKPTRDSHGRPLPPSPTPGKPRTDLAGKPAQKKEA